VQDKPEQKETVMDSTLVLDVVCQALRRHQDARFVDVSYDGDNDSAEIIITMDDGRKKTEWVIRSKDVTETDGE
jgi:hypothetical protein